MIEKVLVAALSAVAGGLFTYSAKALTIEGRLDGIERSIVRIESRLFPPTATATAKE